MPCSLPGRYRQRISVRCLELSSQEEILGFRRCEIAFPASGLRTWTLWQRLPRGVRARKRTTWPCAICRVTSNASTILWTRPYGQQTLPSHRAPRVLTVSVAHRFCRESERSLEPDSFGLPRALRSLVGVFGPDTGLFGVHRVLRNSPSSTELTRLPDTDSFGNPPNPLRVHTELPSSTGLRCCRRPGKLAFRVTFENTQLARQALPISPIESHTLSGATVVNLVVDPKT